MNEKLLTFNEAKEYLRVNKATLHKLIREKELPAFRVGKQLRIDKEELINWLQGQKVNNNNNKAKILDSREPASISSSK